MLTGAIAGSMEEKNLFFPGVVHEPPVAHEFPAQNVPFFTWCYLLLFKTPAKVEAFGKKNVPVWIELNSVV